VVRVLGPRGAGEVEVATFRSDGAYLDGRRPESVRFSSAEEDASRRDFTINGMFFDPLSGSVIDYVGGREDLGRGVVRAIGDPAERFREDKLRLLRAVRFAARFGFRLDPPTRAALEAMVGQIVVVAAERVAEELRKMLVHPSRARAMNLALEVGLVAEVLPPLTAMRGLPQHKPILPEGDLWDHTMLALEHLPARPSFPLAFATLLHDAGKPATRGLKDGRMSFHNHEIVGRRIADDLGRALKFSNAERERICWLVENHQALGEAKDLRESRLKRFLSSPGIGELLDLHRADALASTGDTQQVDYCVWYLENLPQGPIDPPPLVTGHDLQKRLGLQPGPHFKALLDEVREAQLERVVSSKAEALDWLRRRLEADDK
jgi:poly(A) polymerase